MSKLSYAQLSAACEPGGATALAVVTELAAAGGPQAGVAPERYAAGRDTREFCYETRLIDGEPAATVVIDQKQTQLNRIEAAILQSIRDGHPILGRVPRVRVSYDGGRTGYTDLELPQRVFDGHIRAGTVDARPVTDHPAYRAARDCSAADARALLELSPGSLVFGSWDSTRNDRQARYRAALSSEVIGVLADQRDGAVRESKSGAGRVDPVGRSISLTVDQLRAVLAGQQGELSPDLLQSVEEAVQRNGEKIDAGPLLGVGDVAAVLAEPGVVACRRIIRTQVLSFAALRQLRFDSGLAGDVSCRALLAAYALAGLTRSNTELNFRANCDLVEAGPTSVKLDARHGDFVALDPPSIEEADALLDRAIAEAKREADITWQGRVFEVAGNPTVYAGFQPGRADGGDGSDGTPSTRPFWRPLFTDAKEAGQRG
ncbi:MAG TPA: type I-U CRISPR-associated protein Cas7 [Mycobacterium sp.]|nr:type I-U CRISPR-associated protein Cas7 [Mycobacterium sp.]